MVNTHDIDWLDSLELPSLSNKALMLCSQFAREVKRVDGTHLALRDPRLAKNTGMVVRNNQAPVLVRIFNDLIKEIELLVEQRGEPRYRGALASTKLDITDEPSVNPSPSVKTYRGTVITQAAPPSQGNVSGGEVVQPDKPAVETKASKPKIYRGVIVD